MALAHIINSIPIATDVFTATLWFFPALLAAIAYYKYDEIDPESRPINRERLFKEYDFIIGEYDLVLFFFFFYRFICLFDSISVLFSFFFSFLSLILWWRE